MTTDPPGRHLSAADPYTEETPPMDRPNPLKDAASKVGTAWGAVSGLVSALVAFGALTAAQGDAITALGETAPSTITAIGTVIAGVLPVLSALIASFGTASAAKKNVTPVEAPMDNYGNKLTPEGQ